MKKILLLCLFASAMFQTASAATTFIPCRESDVYEDVAAVLTRWEIKNPDKEIVCTSVVYRTGMATTQIQGVLITYKVKPKK